MSATYFNPVSSTPVTSPNYAPTKTLKHSETAGNTQASLELAKWYEEALVYYSAVVNGQETPPSQAAWNEFLNQLQWTSAQLGLGSTWGEGAGDYSGYGDSTASQLPPGAKLGVNGSISYNELQANITFSGEARRQDIWSEVVNLNVPSLSARVHVEKTHDSTLQPPADVLRITIDDPATGESAVYYVENLEAQININTIKPTQVSIDSSVPQGMIAQGTYDPNQAMAGAVSGTPFDDADATSRTWNTKDHVDYVASAGKETDYIYADSVNIALPDRSHRAYVTKTDDHSYLVEIKNAAGETVRRIETEQTNALQFSGVDEENLFYYDGTANSAPSTQPGTTGASGLIQGHIHSPAATNRLADQLGDISFTGHFESFADNPNPDPQVTLAGYSGTTETGTTGPVGGDAPTREDETTRTWDGASYDIYTRGDGKVNDIAARGELHFHATSNLDEYWTVAWEDGGYVIEVHKGSFDGEVVETFRVDDMVQQINFDVASNHIRFEGELGDPDDAHKINEHNDHAAKIQMDYTSAGGIEPEAEITEKPFNSEHPDDSKPRLVSDNGKTATYDSATNVTLHTTYENGTDGISTHEIDASGNVKLYPATQSDRISVNKNEQGDYVVTFTGTDSEGVEHTQTYIVDAAKADKLYIVADPEQVGTSGLNREDQSKLRIGSDTSAPEIRIKPSVDFIKRNLPSDRASNDQTLRAAELMAEAFVSKDWDELIVYLESLDSGTANDAIRNLMHSLYRIAGSTDVFRGMLRQIPENTRRELIDLVQENEGELDGDGGQGNARWTSRETADAIEASLED